MQLIIISGKIGAGKSTLSKCFQRKGYHYINSDMFAKELIASNDSIKKELNNQFTDLNNGNNISVNKLKQIFLSLEPDLRAYLRFLKQDCCNLNVT